MKVLITRNLAKPYPPFKEGEMATVTDKGLLDKLIKEGLAVNPDASGPPLVASPATVGPDIDPKKHKEGK